MHVAITGASSGIGAALAREYARAGAKLTLVARRKELLHTLAAEVGGECHVVAHDLSEPDRASCWLEAAECALGPIDVLVNNAGLENIGPTVETDIDLATRMLNVNLHAPLRLTRALLPSMLERRNGVIVDVASVAAFVTPPHFCWYAASKAGLAAFSEGLRAEVAGSGVHVLTVYPGPVKTPLADSAYAAVGGRSGIVGLLPEGRADVLAERVRRAVEARKKRVVYPRFYAVTRWFPTYTRLLLDLMAPRLTRLPTAGRARDVR